MPKRKSKILYLDTCVVLDYLDKDENTVVLMNSVKKRKWATRTSTFAMVELAEYKRNEIFLWHRLSNRYSLNTLLKSIRNPRKKKKLSTYQLNELSEWLETIQKNLPKFSSLDLTNSENESEQSSWQLAYDLSISTNLNAKDIIHLATAVAAAVNNECDFFITNDGGLYEEADKVTSELKIRQKLKVYKPKEFIEKYPPPKK